MYRVWHGAGWRISFSNTSTTCGRSWPGGLAPTINREILADYTHRARCPGELWRQLFASGKSEIGILIYAGLFLAEDVDLVRIMRDKVEHGVTITEHRFTSPATAGIAWASRAVRLRVDLLRERGHS